MLSKRFTIFYCGRGLFLQLFFCLHTAVFCFDQGPGTFNLDWEGLDEAGSYLLEIRNLEGQKIFEKEIMLTNIELQLTSGRYERRITVLAPDGKILVRSNWEAFEVIVSRIPEINPGQEVEEFAGEVEKEYTITGKNFHKEMEVELKTRDESIELKKIQIINSNSFKFSIKQSVSPSSFSLYLKNPGERKTAIKDFLKFKPVEIAKKSEEEKPVIDPAKEKKNHFSISSVLWRSALIPGWGQYYREDKIRGITYFSLSIIALGATAYNYKQYNKAKTDLASKNSMSGIYSASPELLPLGIINYTQSNQLESRGNKYRSQILICSTAFIGLYIFNLIDAAFFTRSLQEEKKEGVFFFPEVIPSIQSSHSAMEINYSFGYWGKF